MTCLIPIIYNQSGTGNHLYQAPPGYFSGPDIDSYNNIASAISAPVTLNSQKVLLLTYYEGARPEVDSYNPMSKEGALVLGIGGDNSNSAQGTFYEGVITSGYLDDDTKAKVQADIIDAGYTTTSLTSGLELIVNITISLQVTTSGYMDCYLAHSGSTVNTQVISLYSNTTTQQQASWRVRTGLGNSDYFLFKSVDTPGSYIQYSGFELYLSAIEDAQRFYKDTTFCPMTALSGSGNSVQSWSYPTHFIRHFNNVGYIASNGGVQTFDAAKSFNADASWLVISGFSS
ncbi:hypothetical protein CNMCM5623_005525 [Aspergillus felis]|uniref:Alpha-L-arabinofuranosidase n=1 Tax=Aspergillus felis TaxID=1287682 RepID=A0A8H6QIW7_9EURO|nr:hypothetical protein CNMCM5623_005525 [Aspergillus felis]KAF7183651.1 hypothetical protein CNMCM7691_003930 [Aspergillus felis]